MKHSANINQSILIIGFLLVSCAAASAQMASPRGRIPTGIITKSTSESLIRTAPTAAQQNTSEAEGIRDVKFLFEGSKATMSFRARPNVSPSVELGSTRPVKGLGGQLQFETPSELSIIKNDSGQDYSASFSGLESGTRYFYIITIGGSKDSGTRQTQGYFNMP